MTTRALVRPTWDIARTRDHLRDRAATASGALGGRAVRVWTEPLVTHDGRQPIRIEVADARPSRADVRTSGGGEVAVRCEPVRGGLRVLVPEVSEPTRLSVALPEVSAGERIEVDLAPPRHWSVHLVHHSHLDIGYTDPQGTVLGEHLSFLDSCLDLTRETDDWPEDARFRWCVEALWSFEQWAKARPAGRVDELIRRVRDGRIELTAMPFNLHTETCSTDELHELLRLARDVRDRYGVGFTSAMQTDVPGSVVGLVDALAQAGVRYLSVAHNWAGRSVPHLVGGQDLPRLFRWQAPSGASLLVWVTDTPHGLAYMEGPLLGFDESYDAVDDLLPAYLAAHARYPYPYDGTVMGFAASDVPLHRKPYPWDVLHLRVQGKFGDNAPPRRIMAETVRAWNENWAFPRLRLSRNEDFFVDAERRLGDAIETFQGDWNDWWAEGVGSGARPLQLSRRAQGMLADAQTVAGLASARGADVALDTRPAYLAVSLFDEHTWGAANPWTHGDDGMHSGEQQWHWKYGQALQAHDGAAALLDQAAAALAQHVGTAGSALGSFHVVNTCGFSRTDIVEAFLPESRVPSDVDIAVVDARNGKRLPFELEPQRNETHRDAGRILRVSIDDVPPLGTVRLDIVTADAPPNHIAEASEQTLLENEFLRVRVDLATGSIASIVDKATGREIVRADATVGFNGYLYDRYASAGEINHASGKIEGDERLSLIGSRRAARPAALVERRSTATGEQVTYESAVDGALWLRTTLRLPRGVARLDIENRIAKPATLAKESAYFAFPFAVADPTLRAEVTGGVVGSGIPVVPGGAAHMRAMRRWVSLTDNGFATAWSTQDAPLVQIGQIALPYAPFPPTLPENEPGTVFSWVHNNLWDTNFPSQQGFEMTFRYSVAAAAVAGPDAAAVLGMRTAAATSRPFVAVLAAPDNRISPTEQAESSLLRLTDDRVQLVGITAPRPGQLLLRLRSLAGEPVAFRLEVAVPVREAALATYLGDVQRPLDRDGDAVTVTIPPYTAQAVLLEVDR